MKNYLLCTSLSCIVALGIACPFLCAEDGIAGAAQAQLAAKSAAADQPVIAPRLGSHANTLRKPVTTLSATTKSISTQPSAVITPSTVRTTPSVEPVAVSTTPPTGIPSPNPGVLIHPTLQDNGVTDSTSRSVDRPTQEDYHVSQLP